MARAFMSESKVNNDDTMLRKIFVLCTVLLLLGGCATVPKEVERPLSFQVTETDRTAAAGLARPRIEVQAEYSGFTLLTGGYRALETRLALVDLAEKSVDIQTFIWQSDTAGRLLAERLLAAAERGARIRLLIDDFYLSDRDFNLAAFDAHPNINVRVFNPFGTRFLLTPIGRLRRGIELVSDFSRLNHRMHNKVFVVDDELAIIGGRNIGDEYFDLHEKSNLVDLDLLAAGPIVGDASVSFDTYWNSSWAYPITAFREHPSKRKVAAAQQRLMAWAADEKAELGIEVPGIEFLEKLVHGFIWSPAEIIFDDPDKALGEDARGASRVGPRLQEIADQSSSEILISTPYLLPIKDGHALSGALERGVSVNILTNSLASTDGVAAYAGFSKYEKDFITAGIEIFEFKPDISKFVLGNGAPQGSGTGGLHAKVVVFDRKTVFIGTFNLDPRSAKLNTEIGIVVHNPVLAERVADLIEKLMEPENSWRMDIDEGGTLVWRDGTLAESVSHTGAPEAGAWRRFQAFLLSLLPIDDQL